MDSPAANAKTLEIAPSVLKQRELQAELAALIAEPQGSTALAPHLPLELVSTLQGDLAADLSYVYEIATGKLSHYDIGKVASLCHEVSKRLTVAADRGLVSQGSLDLRATYHLLLSLALRHSESGALTRGKDTPESARAVKDGDIGELLHRLSAAEAALDSLTDTTPFAEAQRAHRIYAEILDELELLRLPDVSQGGNTEAREPQKPDLSPGKDPAFTPPSREVLEPSLTELRVGEPGLTPGKDSAAVEPPASPYGDPLGNLRAESERLGLRVVRRSTREGEEVLRRSNPGGRAD